MFVNCLQRVFIRKVALSTLGSKRPFVAARLKVRYRPETDLVEIASTGRFVRKADFSARCSESLLPVLVVA